jgi:hypothetical protein
MNRVKTKPPALITENLSIVILIVVGEIIGIEAHIRCCYDGEQRLGNALHE